MLFYENEDDRNSAVLPYHSTNACTCIYEDMKVLQNVCEHLLQVVLYIFC